MKNLNEHLNNNLGKLLYSDEISLELGVSARTLNNVTRAVMGLSFHQYLRLRRLWSVRWALLSGDPRMMVKSVALDHGFWHLGRFSVEYRRMFGESPSDTLNRR
jgi:AraC family ethanolamine operon transcriptional activator